MRIKTAFFSICYAFLVIAKVHGYHSFRAVPARRRLVSDWPYAFLVSHVGKENGQDWCPTAKNGVTDGSDVGFDLCDYTNAPDDQLFLLDKNGKIHSKVDPTQCLVVHDGTFIKGGSRVKFCACDEQVPYIIFSLNRTTGVIRVTDAPTFCVKQTGHGAQTTDTLRTETCDETNPCFIYDYVEYNCSTTDFADVKCCTNNDCNVLTDICQDYSCVCSTSRPGVDCCTNNDCSEGRTCSEYTCVDVDTTKVTTTPPPPEPGCDTKYFGIECCNKTDCPTDYDCEENTCVTPAVFLVSNIDDHNMCVSANRGVGEFELVGSELCDFTNEPAKQLWHLDTHHMIHSDVDVNRCMIVGSGMDIFSGLHIEMASCKLNKFLFAPTTEHIHLGEDTAYCVTSMQDDSGGMMCAKPCKDTDSFEIAPRKTST